MFKRVIKIILICLVIFLIIVGVIWLIGRHAAQKNGSAPLSFKQFLGLGVKQSPGSTINGGTSSQFTNGSGNGFGSGVGNGGIGSNGGSGIGNNGTGSGIGGANGSGISSTPTVSQFTNSGISPIGGSGFGTGGSIGGGAGNGSGFGTGSNNGGINSSTGGIGNGSDNGGITSGSVASAPVCSTEDTTITFTADEITQLNQLQTQFYTLAQNLHTDADVATELANHDAFELKAEQTAELYNYCEAQLPKITDPNLQHHVATPFWDAWTTGNQWNTSGRTDHDDYSFLNFDAATAATLTNAHNNISDNPDTSGIVGPYGWLSFSNPTAVPVDGSILNPSNGTPDFIILVPVVERILHINLW